MTSTNAHSLPSGPLRTSLVRRTVATFQGTLSEFLDYLESWCRSAAVDEWEIHASMTRHPAGKGLGVNGIETDVHPGPMCGCTPCELRTVTGWWDRG